MKKKILIATDAFLPRWDGVSRFLSELIPFLKKDFEISVICPKYPGKLKIQKNVKMIRMPLRNITFGDYTPAKINKKKMRDAVNEADIIFSQSIGPIGYYAMKYGKKRKKKVISYIHAVEWELYSASITRNWLLKKIVSTATRMFVRSIYNKNDLLIIPSEKIKKTLVERDIRAKKEIAHLGTNVARFIPTIKKETSKKKIKIPSKKIVIGFCSRIGREKDLPTLHKAFLKLNKKYPLTLLIVGKGNVEEERQVKTKNVIMVGSQDDVVPFLQAMDIYVLPSVTETSSLSTMEAMSCGLAVVCTAVGHIPYYIKDGKNGFLFEPGNVKRLTNILKKLIEDEELRIRIGKEARKTIVDDYKWQNTAENIVQILKKS